MLSIEWKVFLGNELGSWYLGWVGYLGEGKDGRRGKMGSGGRSITGIDSFLLLRVGRGE
jgi:hypothetical protein